MKKFLAVFILMCLILSACKSMDPQPQDPIIIPLPEPTDPIIPDDDDDDSDDDDGDDDDDDDD